MADLKLAVIYYSMGGTNYQLAKWAEEGAKEAGAEVRVLKVEELASEEIIESSEPWKNHVTATQDVPVATSEDLEWADAIIFSTPTRFGVMASQMKQFLDIQGPLWAQGGTVNKVVSAMSSANNSHGGQEATILSLYTTMMHWGTIIAAPGFTDSSITKAGGNPYGVSVTVGEDGEMQEDVEDAVKHQVRRILDIAKAVKNV